MVRRSSKVVVLPGQELLLAPVDYAGPTGLVRLEKLRSKCDTCELCPLHEKRTHVVHGEGPWDSPLIAFVGEGPGFYENQQGKPFVGASGRFLGAMLNAMGLSRERVYLTNCVRCRPPNNRNPDGFELEACKPFLTEELDAIKPKVVVTLGKTAAYNLLPLRESLNHMRGRWHVVNGQKIRVTWHPAYVLRKDSEDGGATRWDVWDDMVAVLEELGLPVPERKRPTAPGDEP